MDGVISRESSTIAVASPERILLDDSFVSVSLPPSLIGLPDVLRADAAAGSSISHFPVSLL